MTQNLIDWMSISIPYSNIFHFDENGRFYIKEVDNNHRLKPLVDWLNSFDDWVVGQGRKVFDKSAFSSHGGMTIFWRDTLPYSLVEITGTGMSEIRRQKLVRNFIELYGNWLTRIDVTKDIATDADPRDFARLRDDKKFKSYDEKVENKGITYYVGSRTSERYACVYRYAEPHPRVGLLRVEHRLKGDYAKKAAAELLKDGLSVYIARLGNTFGWSHPAWQINPAVGKAVGVPRDTRQGKTERWLLASVLPAIKNLIANGGDEFVDYFLEQCYNLLIEYRGNRGS